MKKVFLDAIVFVLHIYYYFYWKSKYSKVLKGDIHGTPMGRPGDQMMGRSGDVRGMSVIYIFKIQLKNILNLLWQVTQDFIVNCGSEEFSEQYGNLNNKS